MVKIINKDKGSIIMKKIVNKIDEYKESEDFKVNYNIIK
jgi:hypothetical protein